ncbi:hypothetical protein [Devosia sp. SL43]|uniref:hypothetical protein n=1 Tax=Devosia sp. SL43 TaxID=2806348 RepID=UPI001F248341|nr:hypothetical protein [Devosia sp. SL43]UJW85309.1 hypothetical protein IM737_18205 [Devosia sp. SL43]
MDLPDRHMLLGMTLGALCATVIAFTGPGMVVETFADDLLDRVVPQGFDPSKLVRFEGRKYLVESEDWVSTEPLSTAVVKKVEAGKVSYVTITTTETGTYSTDAMFSDHVQYPGIAVDEVPRYPHNRFSYWSGGNWYGFTTGGANSFFHYRSGNTRVSTYGDTTCVSGRNFTVC